MLVNLLQTSNLHELIESGLITEALALVAENKRAPVTQIAEWFLKSFKQTPSRSYWVEFWSKLLILDLESIKTNKETLYLSLIEAAYHQYHGEALQVLKNFDAKNFDSVIQRLELDAQGLQRVDHLLSLAPEKALYIKTAIDPFVNGLGRINYDAGLLAIAERAHRKNYVFDPTLLAENESFQQYLDILKGAPKPLTARFIRSGPHWMAGEIQITTQGTATLIILDALEEIKVMDLPMAKAFHHTFPKNYIFAPREKKQWSDVGCSLFALDDIAHLTALRLPGKQTLCDYFMATQPEERMRGPAKVYYVKFPLALTRTMQSTRLVTNEIPQRPPEEQIYPVNKKGETAAQSAAQSFTMVPDNEKKQNTRLLYKLDKMAEHIFQYLLKYSEKETTTHMQEATLTALKAKIQAVAPEMTHYYREELQQSRIEQPAELSKTDGKFKPIS